MEKLVRCLLLIGVGFLIMAGTSWSQASESEMRAFPMPPVEGYVAQKTFAYTGDYGYYTFPRQAESSTGIGPEDYVYVRYTGISGKKSTSTAHGEPLRFHPRGAITEGKSRMPAAMLIIAMVSGANTISTSALYTSRGGRSSVGEEEAERGMPPADVSYPPTTR